MKLYIKSKGNGWFTVASNYKNKEDSCTVGLYFPKTTTEPAYVPTEDGKAYTVIINPIEWKLDCYKGKVGLTIFKYELITEEKLDKEVKIEPNDLPFF